MIPVRFSLQQAGGLVVVKKAGITFDVHPSKCRLKF